MRKPIKWFHSGIKYDSPISFIEFLDCNNTRENYRLCSVQQEHQTGVHSRYEGITDDTQDYIGKQHRSIYLIPNRVHPCLMLFSKWNSFRPAHFQISKSNERAAFRLYHFFHGYSIRTVICESNCLGIGPLKRIPFYSYHCQDILFPLQSEMSILSSRSYIPVMLTTPLCSEALPGSRSIKPRMVTLGASRFSWITSPIVWTTMLSLRQYSMWNTFSRVGKPPLAYASLQSLLFSETSWSTIPWRSILISTQLFPCSLSRGVAMNRFNKSLFIMLYRIQPIPFLLEWFPAFWRNGISWVCARRYPTVMWTGWRCRCTTTITTVWSTWRSWGSTLTPVLTYRPFWKWTIPMNSAHRVLQE